MSDEAKLLQAQAQARAERIGAPRTKAHFFLCAGPDCCTEEEGLAVWDYLKRRSKELEAGLQGQTIQRTRAACLRICQDLGPAMVVYPEGRWYHKVSAENCERILRHELTGEGEVADLLISSQQRPEA